MTEETLEGLHHGAAALVRYLVGLSRQSDASERMEPLDLTLISGLIAYLLEREQEKREALERIAHLGIARVGTADERLACALRLAEEGLASDRAEDEPEES